MAKPKNPLLSLGARGTIADTLTFQKRGREHFAREKPIPKDPKSPAQLAWRQVYRDAVAVWNALSLEEKEAWRGVCPGLTAYQCFMRSALVYVPPPIPIDVGADPIDRSSSRFAGSTIIDKNNPANASGILHSIKIWAASTIAGLVVGTFYTTNGSILKCRDSELVGDVEAGAERTFTELSIAVEEGDYIGCYFSTGDIELDAEGFEGIWRITKDHTTPGDEAFYMFAPEQAMSLYGIGEAEA
ncbi:hypothetical protein ES708_30183 [subsurface metagenome]